MGARVAAVTTADGAAGLAMAGAEAALAPEATGAAGPPEATRAADTGGATGVVTAEVIADAGAVVVGVALDPIGPMPAIEGAAAGGALTSGAAGAIIAEVPAGTISTVRGPVTVEVSAGAAELGFSRSEICVTVQRCFGSRLRQCRAISRYSAGKVSGKAGSCREL